LNLFIIPAAPLRIFSLLKDTSKQISNASMAVQEVKSLFTSSDYLLSQLFPVHNKKTDQNNTRKHKLVPFNASKFFTLSTFHQRPFILEILSDEINLKKQALQQYRSEQAANLGILLLTPPQFAFGEQAEFTTSMASETKQCIEMIKYVMEPPSTLSKPSEKNAHHLQQQLSSMNLDSQSSARNVTLELHQVVKAYSSSYHQNVQRIQSLYGAPSVWTRYWIPALVSYVVGRWAISYGLERKEDIVHGIKELGKTAHDFVLNWIWEPVRKVYETIRLKDQRLSILSKEGLQSDMDVSQMLSVVMDH
jgi:nuclear-control-of-ATPase protein 2